MTGKGKKNGGRIWKEGRKEGGKRGKEEGHRRMNGRKEGFGKK
jgi:hypothetical protein